jgi:hypothetical protein
MWKLKRGSSTLFILADLLEKPGVDWDSRCFEKTVQGAKAVYLQADWGNIPSEGKSLRVAGTLKYAISRKTYDRFRKTARRLFLDPTSYESYKPQWVTDAFVQYIHDTRGVTFESYPDSVPGMARRANVPIRTVAFYQGTYESRNIRNRLNDAGAEACMNSGLDRVDYLIDTLPTVADAWGKGDMATVLKLFPDPEYGACVPPGDTSDRDLHATNMKNWSTALDAALNTPGKTVAVVPLDWLLYKGGVLDQLKASGVDVIAPTGTDDSE